MLRSVASKIVSLSRPTVKTQLLKSLTVTGVQKRNYSEEEIDPEDVFEGDLLHLVKSKDIDGYQLRSIVTEIHALDKIPGPELILELMNACRRLNDYALTTRILECVKFKCGDDAIYSTLMNEIKPSLDKLGILTIEQMGYDKPELYLKSVWDMHN